MTNIQKRDLEESSVGFQNGEIVYAGFWWRTLAALLDFLFFVCVVSITTYLVRPIVPKTIGVEAKFAIEFFTFIALSFVYYPLCEASSMSGTAGKRLLGITVKNKNNERISILRAVARHIVRIFSGFLYMSGFVICALTKHKQSAHDYLTKTYVFRAENPIRLSEKKGPLTSGAIGLVNSYSTLLVGVLASVISLFLLVSMIAASAVFAEAVRLRSIGANLVAGTLPVRQYAEMNIDKDGHFPGGVPDEVLKRAALPKAVSIKYEGGSGVVTLLLETSEQRGIKGFIKLSPKKVSGSVIWSCNASEALAEILPLECITSGQKTGV